MHLDSFEPETLDRAVRGSSIDHVQLSPGRFKGNLLRARFGSECCLDWGCYNLPLLARGQMPSDKITLGFVAGAAGHMDPGVLNGFEVTRPTAFFMSEGSELHYKLPAQSPWLGFQMARSEMEEIVSISLGHQPGPFGSAVAGCMRREREMMAIVGVLIDIANHNPAVPDPNRCLQQVEAHLLDFFSAELAAEPSTSVRKISHLTEAVRLVRGAVEVMEAHLDDPLRIGTICSDIGCDWKRLERAFRTVYGVTPKRFLIQLRLTKARRLLLQANEVGATTRVAAMCGIHHLGRFSGEYLRMFGERPSDTLSRSLSRVK